MLAESGSDMLFLSPRRSLMPLTDVSLTAALRTRPLLLRVAGLSSFPAVLRGLGWTARGPPLCSKPVVRMCNGSGEREPVCSGCSSVHPAGVGGIGLRSGARSGTRYPVLFLAPREDDLLAPSGTLAELCDLDAAGGGPGGGPGRGIPGRHPFLDPASEGSLLGNDELPIDTASADEARFAAGGCDTSASFTLGGSWYARACDSVTT
jgi:hypothetical protein